MLIEWMYDPSAWVGLLTLIVLEIVLGIDNLVFIAILAEKLPPEQRNKARVIGLSLALGMRLVLLASIAWVVTLTKPLFHILEHPFSGRDLILLFGGLFLLFKATMELHERIAGKEHIKDDNPVHAAFWVVIAQIVVLDAVFSLDSVITAVGMVKDLSIMITAVVVAMVVMLWFSKALMDYVNKHPTVVILCLGFLWGIGLLLVAEGFGFHIPKAYLYAAIGFSVLVEGLNQLTRRKQEKRVTTSDLRYRTASAVLRMLGGKNSGKSVDSQQNEPENILKTDAYADEIFDEQHGVYHSVMVQGVLGLSERPVKSIMTPRPELEWINFDEDAERIQQRLMKTSHTRLIVARGELDNLQGIVATHSVFNDFVNTGKFNIEQHLRQPLVVHENAHILMVMEQLRQTPLQMAIVLNEYGSIEGILTPIDVLEAIAGEFKDENEPEVVAESLSDGSWILEALTDIRHVSLLLGQDLVDENEQYSTLSGFILAHFGRLPAKQESFIMHGYRFTVMNMDGQKIDKVHIESLESKDET